MKEINNFVYPADLYRNLEYMLASPLTLVAAGSGFGKTTAISNYLEHCLPDSFSCHWYTCFGEPPERAWAEICRLLSKADKGCAKHLSRLDLPLPGVLGYISQFMDDFSCEEDTVLVIDNYHLARFPEPYMLLEALSLHRCQHLHLVVITQPIVNAKPTKKFCTNIYSLEPSCFCFQPEDICTLYVQNGISIPFSSAKRLHDETGGWIAALRLNLSLSLSSGRLTDYESASLNELISHTLWEPLCKEEKHFLFLVSLLSNFTELQLFVLLDTQEVPANIWNIIRNNPFIRTNHTVYTVHSLFRGFLADKFLLLEESERLNAWERAGKACLMNQEYFEAVQFLLMAGKYNDAFLIPLNTQETAYFIKNAPDETEKWLLSLPDDIVLSNLEQMIAFGIRGAIGKSRSITKAVFSRLEELSRISLPEPKTASRVLASLEMISSFKAFNHASEMGKHYQAAWELAKTQIYHPNGQWTFCSPSVVFMFWRKNGDLENAWQILHEKIHYYCNLAGGGSGMGSWETMKAEMLLLSGNVADAVSWAQKAIYVAEKHQQDSLCFCARLTLCRANLLMGNISGYKQNLDAINRLALSGEEQNCAITAELGKGFLFSVMDWPDQLPDWLTSLDSITEYLFPVTETFAKIIYAQQLRRTDPERLLPITEKFIEEAEALHQMLPKVYFLLEQTVWHKENGARDAAVTCLSEALSIALPDEVYLPFAERYDMINDLLYDSGLAVRPPADSEQLDKIKQLGVKLSKGFASIRAAMLTGTAPLTPREREIAILAKEQLSTKEIAAQLTVSPATVKNTLNKVYSKLNIQRKSELLHINF